LAKWSVELTLFVMTMSSMEFFPPDTPDWLRELQTYGIFAGGYVAPEGGTIMAHFGDRLGRKRRRERGGHSFAPDFA
jgi:hypothetical protein